MRWWNERMQRCEAGKWCPADVSVFVMVQGPTSLGARHVFLRHGPQRVEAVFRLTGVTMSSHSVKRFANNTRHVPPAVSIVDST